MDVLWFSWDVPGCRVWIALLHHRQEGHTDVQVTHLENWRAKSQKTRRTHQRYFQICYERWNRSLWKQVYSPQPILTNQCSFRTSRIFSSFFLGMAASPYINRITRAKGLIWFTTLKTATRMVELKYLLWKSSAKQTTAAWWLPLATAPHWLCGTCDLTTPDLMDLHEIQKLTSYT